MQQMHPAPGCVVERVLNEATRSTVVRVRATSDEARCLTCRTVSRTPPTAPRQYRPEVTAGDARDGASDATAKRAGSRASTAVALPSTTQLAWLLIRPPDSLSESDAYTVRHFRRDGEAARVAALVQRLATLV